MKKPISGSQATYIGSDGKPKCDLEQLARNYLNVGNIPKKISFNRAAEIALLSSAFLRLYKFYNGDYSKQVQERDSLRSSLATAMEGLERIVEGYIQEDNLGADCSCCDFDGFLTKKHHSNCVYVIARSTLSKLGGEGVK